MNEKQGHVVGFGESAVSSMEVQQRAEGCFSGTSGLSGNVATPKVNMGTKLDDLYCSVDMLDAEVGQLLGRLRCIMPPIPICTEPEEKKQCCESEFIGRLQLLTDKVVTIKDAVNEANRLIQI